MTDEMNQFLDDETSRIEKERAERMEGKDYKTFWKASVGENHVVFLKQVPRVGQYGKIFRISVNGTDYDFTIKETSPLYREIIKNLKAGRYNLKIIRIGTGKTDTRYSVIAE
jgi:hypothetical protein